MNVVQASYFFRRPNAMEDMQTFWVFRTLARLLR